MKFTGPRPMEGRRERGEGSSWTVAAAEEEGK